MAGHFFRSDLFFIFRRWPVWLLYHRLPGTLTVVSLTLKVSEMNIRSMGWLSLALAVCLSSALVAQDEGRGRGGPGGRPGGGAGGGAGGGRGFGGGFGGGMGMGMGGGAFELMGLLRMEEVQKELEMTPEVYQSVQDVMPNMRGMRDASPEERIAKMKEANTKMQEVIDEVLSPDQQKRLLGLLVQQQGLRAATNDLVAKQIGLDEATLEKLKEEAMKVGQASREKMREAFAGGFDPEKAREAGEAMRKDLDEAMGKLLSDEQKQALEELKGEKFTFPEFGGFGGGGRGGPGGFGRGPGGGGRGQGRGGDNSDAGDN